MTEPKPLQTLQSEGLLAQPQGCCAGVVHAIEIEEFARELYGPPVYVRHEIVHHQLVVRDLERRMGPPNHHRSPTLTSSRE